MSEVTVAATQMSCSWDMDDNIAKAESLVRQAASAGAQIILIQELFQTPYFPIEQCHKHRALAKPVEGNALIAHFSKIAAELKVVLPISFFEQAGQAYFNTVAMLDSDGTSLGIYRKSHIPNDVAYQEKQFFSPGDTGFKVFETAYGNVGVGICWDQWFPEAARVMALKGADILLYPTAIGSGLQGVGFDDAANHWRNTMCGHAAANIMPVVASNRIGREHTTEGPDDFMDFYGNSFIADHEGNVVEQAGDRDQEILLHSFDFEKIGSHRAYWATFRDRRPDLYGAILTMDGKE